MQETGVNVRIRRARAAVAYLFLFSGATLRGHVEFTPFSR